MVKKIKSLLFAQSKGRGDIGTIKKAKLIETQSYLVSQRNLQPSAPIGFKPRSTASYYGNERF